MDYNRFDFDSGPGVKRIVRRADNGDRIPVGKTVVDRHEAMSIIGWLNDGGGEDIAKEATRDATKPL
jgi:hypothetical protein